MQTPFEEMKAKKVSLYVTNAFLTLKNSLLLQCTCASMSQQICCGNILAFSWGSNKKDDEGTNETGDTVIQ